jgi:hypothetical protein
MHVIAPPCDEDAVTVAIDEQFVSVSAALQEIHGNSPAAGMQAIALARAAEPELVRFVVQKKCVQH